MKYTHYDYHFFTGIALLAGYFFIQNCYACDDSLLNIYILEGLKNNCGLSREKTNLESAQLSIKESRAKFMPSISLQTRYSKSQGGRTIDLPVGSLINPVYRNLDAINRGTLPPYPTIENMSFVLQPTDDQETKLQIVQPLFFPSIPYNYTLQKHLAAAAKAKVETFERNLIRDIRNAYYTALQAQEAVCVYKAALQRSLHQRNAAQKLSSAGKLNGATLLSAQADAAAADAKYAQSCADLTSAKRALNLILNRDLESEPLLQAPDSTLITAIYQIDFHNISGFESHALRNRDELTAIRESIEASEMVTSIEKTSLMPTVGAAFESGFVGEKFEFSKKTNFFTASILLQWQLFSGTERIQKIQKSRLSVNQLRALYKETSQLISFQVRKVCQDLELAKINCSVADQQISAAEKNYEAVLKRYELGDGSSMEMTDAATVLTSANVNKSILLYTLFMKNAELRHVIASDTLHLHLGSEDH